MPPASLHFGFTEGQTEGSKAVCSGWTRAAPRPIRETCRRDLDNVRHSHVTAEPATAGSGAHAMWLWELPYCLRGNAVVSSRIWISAART